MTNGVACHLDGGGEDNSICQILQMRIRMGTVGIVMRVIWRMRIRKMRKMTMMVIVPDDGDVEEVRDDDDNGGDVC